MRTVITSQKFVGDVVSRLVKHYDRVLVTRDKADPFLVNVVATSPTGDGESDDFGGSNPVVFAGLANQLPNCC